ncbi:LemA family protein [Ramlibacter sp. MAHUQ-53]|uniref:LemA family protein n=1 Tax=unclassified Ramlibacter TaxID=2617605 RepID=UPI003631186B
MTTLLMWLLPAVLLFWSVGAYNRLVRLRGEVKSAFASVEAEFQRHLQLAQDLPPDDGEDPARARGSAPVWAQVRAATDQLASTLAGARARPLDPQGIEALRTATDVLAMAWDRAEREDAHDLGGPRLPETHAAVRAQVLAQVQAATQQFNDAVTRYNRAIAQFPAVLLAWVFGFRAGTAL